MLTGENIRNKGGFRSILGNEIAREIWMWYREKQIWLYVSHIPGFDNVLEDKESRVFDVTTDWKLDEAIYLNMTNLWGRLKCLLPNSTIRPNHIFPGDVNHMPWHRCIYIELELFPHLVELVCFELD